MPEVSCRRPTPPLPNSNQPVLPFGELLIPVIREEAPLPSFALPRGLSDFRLSDLIVLYWLATLARASYSADATLFTSAARAVLPPNYPITFVPNAAGLVPGYSIIRMPLALIVVVSGTTNLAQWMDQIFSTQLVSTDIFAGEHPDKAQTMAIYKTAADTISAAVTAISNTLPVLTVGHSMGGAIACVLNNRYNRLRTDGTHPRTVTFGSPKPGNSHLVNGMRTTGAGFRRVIIGADFVPALPPDFSAANVLIPQVFRATSDQWALYQQPGIPYYLFASGELAAGREPFISALQVAAMLAAAAGQPIPLLTSHRPKTFCDYLRAGIGTLNTRETSNWTNPNTLEVVNASLTAAGL